ncbi:MULTISPECIES: hypothetical protein [Pseudoalteromonas]|uniref:Uncharacterized protein n=1 Tax=Pseudoalteromonas amylolytica TaxID=1859457 RepID=A0A1S1MX12_9GAMM|nr:MULTISPECIES: hypothetical protein [Pseudoalteromonas]OHU87978.1 hypothetical protein BFC16_11290 [Pseudoalteromonas sp. JW3]OHU91418.1 hypothetical protein BET10_11410 [Pseudoalteromonas amylolytica]
MNRVVLLLLILFTTLDANAIKLHPEVVAIQKDLVNLGMKKNVGEVFERHKSVLIENELDTQSRDLIHQFIATYFSFIGLHEHAEQLYQFGQAISQQQTLYNFTAYDALDEITTLAKQRKLLMVNEAHHIPKHRWLTKELLIRLKNEGYSYLALEALAQKDELRINKQGYATNQSGIYLRDPAFSELVSVAKELGYTLVSYDKYMYDREKEGAENIINKTFALDPYAKVIVHCGYSHIDEKHKLASILAEKLDIDPLTIDQTALLSTHIADVHHWAPVVFKSEQEQYWQPAESHFDIAVYWPKQTKIANRPAWYMANHKSQRLDEKWCDNTFPCYVEVGKNIDNTVPFDRYLWLNPAKPAYVRVRYGDSIFVYGKTGHLLKQVNTAISN